MSTKSETLDRIQLTRLYVRLEKPLYNVVFRWVWNREDAADVVQDAFIRLWKMRDRVDMNTVEPLVYRIALNLASNRRRANKVRSWIGLGSEIELASEEADPEKKAELLQRQSKLRAAIDALPEGQRKVVVMCELSGLSYAEVAGVLQIPQGTVGSRRNLAMKRLRTQLSEVIT